MAVLPDGRVVSGSGDKTLRIWDSVTGECVKILEGHAGVYMICDYFCNISIFFVAYKFNNSAA